MYSTQTSAEAITAGRSWPPALRLVFRLAFVYIALYLLPQWLFLILRSLSWIPGIFGIANAYAAGWQWIELWVGRNVLAISTPIDVHTLGTGSGDTLLNYLELLCQSALAVVAAVIWTALDAKRTTYDTLHQWLRVYVRYALCGILLSYGTAKVFFPGQFAHPTLDRLIEPFGHSSPMGLLWTFMGYSRAYTFFTGAVECAGGLLLLSQRTTMLGALVVAAAMGNVAVLNFSYDVPVKLYSTQLFLLAVFLLIPEIPRFVRVFVTNQPAEAAPFRKPFTTVWRHRAALAAKWIVIAGMLWQNFGSRAAASRQPPRPRSPRYGIYEVDSFVANGVPRPAAPMDARRWRRVIVSENGGVSVQTMDDATIRYRTKDDPAKQTFELSTIFSPYDKTVLTYR
ncbi:MAG TPA: hypothetical protein VGY57_04010, partial [Vicinamibacterales bacterium]|nr:hypothetical protein [Vicinamibacterales bacterium]